MRFPTACRQPLKDSHPLHSHTLRISMREVAASNQATLFLPGAALMHPIATVPHRARSSLRAISSPTFPRCQEGLTIT